MIMLALQNENIDIAQSLLLSVVAMCIIIGVLACIMGMIYLMSFIFKQIDNRKKKAQPTQEAIVAEQPKVVELAKGSCGEIALHNVSDKEAAMIMAIVADKLNTPINQLRFKSIREVED